MKIQEFEDSLEQFESMLLEIKELRLNEFSGPFATWVFRAFVGLSIQVGPEDMKNLLLENDPTVTWQSLLEHVGPVENALRVFSSFHQ